MALNVQKPNVILIILDAVGARAVTAYGDAPGTAPGLDAFAAENVLFKRAFFAATCTISSHASLLTGLYLSQHRIESTRADRYFNDDIVTLPAALRSHGYSTAAFSQNFLFIFIDSVEERTAINELHQILERWRSGLASFPPTPISNVVKSDVVIRDRLKRWGNIE